MLLPRPEMRIATQPGLRIVDDGPILGGIPAARLACHRAAARTFLDPADCEYCFAGTFQCLSDRVGLFCTNNHRHSNSAVERPRHFFRRKSTAFLKQRENKREMPAFSFNHGVAMVRQDSRNLLQKPAAGNMCKSLDLAALDERQEGPDVDPRRF